MKTLHFYNGTFYAWETNLPMQEVEFNHLWNFISKGVEKKSKNNHMIFQI